MEQREREGDLESADRGGIGRFPATRRFPAGIGLFTFSKARAPCLWRLTAIVWTQFPWLELCVLRVCGAFAMSDFIAAFLVIITIAAVGNFAADPDAFQTHCAGNWLQICW